MVMIMRSRMSNRSAERRFISSLPVLTFCSALRKIAFRSVSSISTANKEHRSPYMSGKMNKRYAFVGNASEIENSLRLLA